jgi:ATP-binding cassette subfamily B protein RaxB
MIFNRQNKITPILQDEISECGLACVTMILNYYGKRYSLNYMRDKYYSNINGFNFVDILNISKKEELIPLPFNIDEEDFKNLNTPCIAHLKENHFVIINKISKNKVEIIDPLEGKIEYKINEFFKKFSFNVCEFEKEDCFKKSNGDIEEVKESKNIFNFVKNVEGFWSNIFRILLLSFSIEVFILIIPFFYKLIIDNVIMENNQNILLPLGISFLFIVTFKSLSEWFRKNMVLFLSSHLEKNIKYGLMYKLLKLPVTYFQKRGLNNVITKINSFEGIKNNLSKGIIYSIMESFTVIVTGTFMLYLSPILFSIVFSFMILIFILRYSNLYKLKKIFKRKMDSTTEEESFIIEAIKQIEITKGHSEEDFVFKKWYSHYVKSSNNNSIFEKTKINFNTLEELFINFQRIIVIWLGAAYIINSEMSIGVLIIFFSYQIIFSQQSLNLISNLIEFKLLNFHFDKINDIKKQKDEKYRISSNNKNIDFNGDIELKNVYFKYEENEDYILKNISLIIKKGESIVITGDSGVGKSTLLKIIAGLIPINKGELLINGINIKHIGLERYRKKIGIVLQNNNYLSSGSIVDNITNFKDDYDVEKVIDVTKKACIHADIEILNMNYDTNIGDISNSLSGGQIQRILLAKALYREPNILFIDEGTSSLDISLEKEIIENLKKEKMTKITVAHREESKKMADRIINLNELKG